MTLHVHEGRTYTVLAQFVGPDRQAGAREYMRTHLHTRVLCETDSVVYMAWDRDFGQPEDLSDCDFGNVGWKSLYTGDDT
ncbi:MAG: hypothetical protein Q8R98_05080 [Rubrivivax sp.]|nr:hypothetical protein [Rubrivivax sp.]MDP3611205.1 hypothetical protein [Rubrivivax sp.]